jgi:nucleotide-binding universal stress UspA family protein
MVNKMNPFKKIMVAVDFSDHSLSSVRHAVRMARLLGAELLLVNVINQRDVEMIKQVADKAINFSLETYLKDTVVDRKEAFESLIEQSECNSLTVNTHIRVGHPYEELLKEIDEKKPDLLVMGVKGRSNLIDAVIGSCAQKMFRRCPVPLLSIR